MHSTARGPPAAGGSAGESMTEHEKRHLDEHGYVVLDGRMGGDLLNALRTRILELFAEEGERAGHEFRTEEHAHRLANLVDKGQVFSRAIVLPGLLDYIRHVLGPEIKLSSLNARSADPDTQVGQPLHVDMSAIPDDNGYWVCNTVWMLDDSMAPHPQEVLLTGKAGGIAVMNAHMWHGGTANRTAAPRLAMHAFYCRRDKPQQQYQKQLLRPDIQAGLSSEVRDILALDDPLNDELSSVVTVRSGFLK
jgi:hypothetical protein